MQEHHIKIAKTAHYYTLGEVGKHIRKFWIVCHGYGQLASSFLEEFKVLESEDTFIIAPEGLSRFYWGGFSGPVVSSWMTRKDRLFEIEDYCHFLQGLYDHYLPQFSDDVQINLLGFSQGTATQCRWIFNRQPFFHRLLLWSGILPDDLDFRPLAPYFADKQLLFLYGTDDFFLTQERLDWQFDFAQKNKLNIENIAFEGKHKIDQPTLQRIAQKVIV